MKPDSTSQTRRYFLGRTGLSLGSIALGTLVGDTASASPVNNPSTSPLAPRPPHHAPRAKSVIHLFMAGGPSQLELFDHKPKLQELHGQTIPKSFIENKRFAFLKG